MKGQEFIKWTFLTLALVTLLSLVTPLAFANIWMRNVVYLLTVILSFFFARQAKNRFLKAVVAWLPLLFFVYLVFSVFVFSFANRISDDWRTAWISHRRAGHKEVYVSEQILDVGALGYARRTVQVTPVTSLFNWITKADTSALKDDWVRVNEDYNPYNLKY